MDDTTVVKRPDANRDPITGTPGAHPVGTGIGAAAGGIAAGAAAGTLAAGPVGTVIGAAVGAVAGGLAGKAIAERIDPTVVDEYWEGRFDKEPYYEPGMTFDDYAPGYRLGADARQQYADRSFDDMEAALENDYENARGTSRLDWEDAKRPVRAGWEARYR
ncbi:MAG: hypothetical protein ACREBN_01985 [Burkholderiaceae bacterium]